MASITIGIIVFVGMIVGVIIGLPIYVAVILASCAGLYFVGGPEIIAQQLSTGLLSVSASYTFAVIPMFCIVGTLAGATGLADDAFLAVRKWLSRLRGGLLYTVVCANAIFGACSGVSAAGSMVFAKMAMPEMKRAKYDESLSYGCITASGSLSALIPPSVGIMTVCLLSENSIGTGLMCGLAAGILMVLVMFAMIKVYSVLQPEKVPAVTDEDRAITWSERLKSLRLLLPILFLFALIVGGSFFGWFPPTVGGGIACAAITIYALFKRVSIKEIFKCYWNGVIDFSGIFLIIIGSQLFSRVVAMTGIASAVTTFISSTGFPPFFVFLLVIVFFVLCGCVMDAMSVILITVSVIYPLLTSIGYNGYVVCIVLVLLAELGNITPPFGLSIFSVASVMRENPTKIFKGIWPFLIVFVALIILIILVPDVILWLPRILGAAV